MSGLKVKDNFELRAINKLENLWFYVDDYQRGYKWRCQQTLDLINDIDAFSVEEGIYCLQPIVLKERRDINSGKTIFELIDGQQRVSTLFILLNTQPEKNQFFNIEYGTRQKSAEFLKSINTLEQCYHLEAELLQDSVKLEKELCEYWEEYVAENQEYNNVDNFHFFLCYQTVSLWVHHKSELELVSFFEKLLDFTYVIWYQVEDEELSEEVFININSGKIELTNAELIKALFLINCKDDSNKEITAYQQNEIAQEWDRIENSLQDDEFWYFINADSKNHIVPTRIDFLFDLLAKKKKNESNPYFSYRVYAKKVKEEEKLNWEEVKQLYEHLKEWHKNRKFYHLIGFIISQNIYDITGLIKLSKGLLKTKFEQEVIDLIRKEFRKKNNKDVYRYHLDHLDYKDAYKETLAVLLLFNIETYQISDTNYRFPFHLYKKEKWSIEHIHAQNAGLFNTIKEIKEWVADLKVLIKDSENTRGKIPRLDTIKKRLNTLNKLKNDAEFTPKLKAKLVELTAEIEQYFSMHKINNLALLDGKTNSSIGNKNFLRKREGILSIGKVDYSIEEKPFIPTCTKNVFLKYYTKSNDDIQMTYWGYQDGLDYKEAIRDLLKRYY